jgi:hypothetical protein
MWIRIRELFDPGPGMEKFGSGIRYTHPGSATLVTKDISTLLSSPCRARLYGRHSAASIIKKGPPP